MKKCYILRKLQCFLLKFKVNNIECKYGITTPDAIENFNEYSAKLTPILGSQYMLDGCEVDLFLRKTFKLLYHHKYNNSLIIFAQIIGQGGVKSLDEFNAISEESPELITIIAVQVDMSIGVIRQHLRNGYMLPTLEIIKGVLNS